MSIDTTVAGDEAQSYADATSADAYFDTTARSTDWDAIGNSSAKELALLEAMPFIESLDWIGRRSTQEQALEWPRTSGRNLRWSIGIQNIGSGVVDLRGRRWPVTAIPQPVINAQCEMALAIAQDASWIQDIDDVESIRTGVVTLRRGEARNRRRLPSLVQQWIDSLVIANGGAVRLLKA